MGLGIFTISVWIGWLSGLLFLRKPWGYPEFDSWCSFYPCYSLVTLFVGATFGIDYYSHRNSYSENILGEDDNLELLMRTLAILETISTAVFLRVYFIVNAKRIATFLNWIYHNASFNSLGDKRKFRKSYTNFLSVIVIVASISLQAAITVLNFSLINHTESWMAWLGHTLCSILFITFAVIPTNAILPTAYVLVMAIAVQLHDDFLALCDDAENFVKNTRGEVNTEVFHIRNIREAQENEAKCQIKRKLIMENFERIQKRFKIYDSTMGPIILILIFSSVFKFIHGAYGIIITHHTGAQLAYDYCTYFDKMMIFIILLYGQALSDNMNERKTQLLNTVILMPPTMEKHQMGHAILLITDWDWCMSAYGFFNVNKSLASGIVKTTMSYVVLLFQLHIAYEGQN